MIMRFADKQTVAVFADLQICRFGAEVLRVAQRKLAQLHRAERIKDLAVPPGNSMEKFSDDRNANGVFASMISGGFALSGAAATWDTEIVDHHYHCCPSKRPKTPLEII
jgi:proteic killer suppression protein